jgi:hypothetical protein
MIRIVIDEPRFRRLVAGEVVRFKTAGDKIEVECILSDIGWPRILRAVLDGIAPEPGRPKGPPDPPEARELNSAVYRQRRGGS